MNVDISFEYGSLDFNSIKRAFRIIEQFRITAIELSCDQVNHLTINPVTKKRYKQNRHKKFRDLETLEHEIENLMERDFYVFINFRSGLFLIFSSGYIGAKDGRRAIATV